MQIFRLFGKLCVDKPKAKALFNTGLIPIVFTLTEEKQFSSIIYNFKKKNPFFIIHE